MERGAAGDRHRDRRRALREAWCVARVTYRPELGAPRRSRQPRLTCVPPSPHTHPPPSRSSIPRTPPSPLVLLRPSVAATAPGALPLFRAPHHTDSTNISPEAMAYMSVPGIWTDEQVAGWRQVTEGVHAKGGKVGCQLWHTVRVWPSHRMERGERERKKEKRERWDGRRRRHASPGRRAECYDV